MSRGDSAMSDLPSRKADHLDLCATGDVGFRDKTTLLECVELVHDALPEMSLDDVDLSVTVLGKRLRAPILIAAMTGGTDRAREINKGLAAIAEERRLRLRPRQPAGDAPSRHRRRHRRPDLRRSNRSTDRAPPRKPRGGVQAREISRRGHRRSRAPRRRRRAVRSLEPGDGARSARRRPRFCRRRGRDRAPRPRAADPGRRQGDRLRPRPAGAGSARRRRRRARRCLGLGRHVVGRGRDGACGGRGAFTRRSAPRLGRPDGGVGRLRAADAPAAHHDLRDRRRLDRARRGPCPRARRERCRRRPPGATGLHVGRTRRGDRAARRDRGPSSAR